MSRECLMNWWGSLPGDYLDGPISRKFSFLFLSFFFGWKRLRKYVFEMEA